MKSRITVALAIAAVAAGVGWKLSRSAEPSVPLHDIRVVQGSERAYPGPGEALAGIRIRISPSDLADERLATAQDVPRIDVSAQ